MITQKYLEELTYQVIGSPIAYLYETLKAPKEIIINFNCFNIFNEGQKTFVNEYLETYPSSKYHASYIQLCAQKNFSKTIF